MLSERDVSAFKTRYCADENPTISRILKAELSDWVVEPILDVGSGLGDIALEAFPEKDVYLLDRLDFAREPKAARHKRQRVDFWDYRPNREERPGTILLSHVLQFLDDDPSRFNSRLRELGATKVIAVLNRDTGTLHDIVRWAHEHLGHINPEKEVSALFDGFRREGEWPFEAHLACPDFQTLAEQVGYLLDVHLSSDDKNRMVGFFRDSLVEPAFVIQQHIVIYAGDKSAAH
jgi:hypothetical protein